MKTLKRLWETNPIHQLHAELMGADEETVSLLAKNPHTHPDILDELSRHPSVWVKQNITMNGSTHPETLSKMYYAHSSPEHPHHETIMHYLYGTPRCPAAVREMAFGHLQRLVTS